MTPAYLAKYVGRTGLYKNTRSGLTIPIRTLDARKAYGRVEVKVTPVGGSGQKWVDVNNLKLEKETK